MGSKGYSYEDLFGNIQHYDSDGHKIGESRPSLFGGYTDYDADGHKTGRSEEHFFGGGFDHYDNHGNKTGRSDENLFGGYSHYDEDGSYSGYSDRSILDVKSPDEVRTTGSLYGSSFYTPTGRNSEGRGLSPGPRGSGGRTADGISTFKRFIPQYESLSGFLRGILCFLLILFFPLTIGAFHVTGDDFLSFAGLPLLLFFGLIGLWVVMNIVRSLRRSEDHFMERAADAEYQKLETYKRSPAYRRKWLPVIILAIVFCLLLVCLGTLEVLYTDACSSILRDEYRLAGRKLEITGCFHYKDSENLNYFNEMLEKRAEGDYEGAMAAFEEVNDLSLPDELFEKYLNLVNTFRSEYRAFKQGLD